LDFGIVKHGNRAVSGKVGAADVLEECGINFEGEDSALREQFYSQNFLFLFAPLYHRAMRHAVPIRAALKFPTIFNFLGPLCNPSNPDGAAIGVAQLQRLSPMSEAARLLNKNNYFFYSSEDGYDEISTAAPTQIFSEGRHIETVEPQKFFEPFPIPYVENLVDSASKFRYMLSGCAENPEKHSSKESAEASIDPDLGRRLHYTVCLNAAVVLYLFGKAASIPEAFELLDTRLREGVGRKKLAALSA
ncbi:MAG: hypothetical protein AAF975_01405, partial [Spirochaetota bacterium]